MNINNQIEALSIRNTATKAVNMTEFNNPFLLLSSTKALNELVVNTNPSSRAKVANIEPTKSKFQQNPLGVPIDVYTKDTATGAKVSRKKLKADAISKRSKQTASSAISAALSNVGKKKAKVKVKAKAKATESKIYTTKPTKESGRTEPKPKSTIGGGVKKETVVKKRGPINQGKTAAREAEATKRRVAKAKKALEKAGAGGMGGF
tara:strand:- start:197 stop:814 length:618 start_codon:yes stop_codon:yes gene_type:complete